MTKEDRDMLRQDRDNYHNKNDNKSSDKRMMEEMRAEINELRSHMTNDVPSQVGYGAERSTVSQVTLGRASIMGGRNEQESKRRKTDGSPGR